MTTAQQDQNFIRYKFTVPIHRNNSVLLLTGNTIKSQMYTMFAFS